MKKAGLALELSPGFEALRAELGLVDALERHLLEGDHVGPFERFERDGWTDETRTRYGGVHATLRARKELIFGDVGRLVDTRRCAVGAAPEWKRFIEMEAAR